MTCPVCDYRDAVVTPGAENDYEVGCEQCGSFRMTHEARVNARAVADDLRWKVSAWICQYLGDGLLTAELLDQAAASTPPGVVQRAHRMLSWIAIRYSPGKSFGVEELGRGQRENRPAFEGSGVSPSALVLIASNLMPTGWNRDLDEMRYMVTEVLCNELGWLASQNNWDYQVAPKGLMRLETAPSIESSIAFCAMWFDKRVESLWFEVIDPAIRLSGYEPLKIDIAPHNEKIDDKIIASIRSARFVVADFTGNRGGVYYEAGFAHGLGLPVIFMCQEGETLHFDVRQYNCIFWTADKLEEARDRLVNRIRATLGQGPLKVPSK
ncbi:MAG: hypothetical protein KF796_00620 [Ramlibacter sp.]|nr:hypothetical protein [Ramlibacter sp.]